MRSDTIKFYMQPAFLICTAVLAIAAIAMESVHVKKAPLPLKKPLGLLDEKAMTPYRVVSKSNIKNKEIVETLGTEDYIQWVLENPDADADSAVRKCLLFITYYELPDKVPHVPEECYMGSGYQRLASDSVTFLRTERPDASEANRDAVQQEIQGRYLVFAGAASNNWWSNTKFPVLYLFNINGLYADSRENARWILNKNVFCRYVYFCKVEWKFFNTKFGTEIYPTKEEAITASQKLLSVILPILETEHWPENR